MKIEFGCGETPTKLDFKTSDIRKLPGVDFVCSAWNIDSLVNPNSVEEIFSRHFFEHLTFLQGEKVLEAWYKILKPSGKVEMILPNMTFHIDQWINKSKVPKQMRHAKAGFWGWQRGAFDDTWDIHKSGYNLQTLTELLMLKGFKNINSLRPPMNKDLHVIFSK
jgi:predicted SAM-dependent methyltransferase